MYDARGSGGGSNSGTMFGLALGGVMVAAFVAVILWPSSGDKNSPAQMAAVNAAPKVLIHAAFASSEEQAFATTLAKVDEAAYRRLEKRFQNGGISDMKRYEIMLEEIETVAFDNVDVLAKADVKHFNAILSDISGGLKQASRSNAKLCKGSSFSALSTMNERQIEKFMTKEIVGSAGVREFGLKLNRRMLEAILDGRKNPKNHGSLQASDQRALQGLGRSLMFQPEIMKLIMAANSGSNPEAALADLDICQLSIAVLNAVDTLNDKTKGRLWAQTFGEIKKQGSFKFNPGNMSGMGGF